MRDPGAPAEKWGLAWLALPLTMACKQAVAMMLVWAAGTGSQDPFGQSMGKRELLGQFTFALLTGIAVLAVARLRRWRRPFAAYVAFDVLLSTVLLVDVVYARQFGAPLGIDMLRHADRFPAVADAALALLRPADALLFADLPVLLALRGRVRRAFPGHPISPRRAAAVLGLCTAGFAAALLAWPARNYLGEVGVSWRLGFVDYHAVDAARTAWRRFRRPGAPEGTRGRVAAGTTPGSGRVAGPLHAAAPRTNVVVLQVESLQGFVLGRTAAGIPLTPNLDRLARESIVVPDFFQQTGLGVSSDADLAVNCSLLPSAERAVSVSYVDNSFHCLPRVLAGAGYHTAALQSLRVDMWNASRLYRAFGYKEAHLQGTFERDEPVGMGLSDASFLRQTLRKLAAMPRPFMAFVVTLSSHAPFVLGDPLPDGDWPDPVFRRYLEAIRYTDRQIGEFVQGLEALALLDDTVLVVYGDHHGVPWSDGAAAWTGMPQDEVSRLLFTRRVPLLIRLPGGEGAGTIEEVASHLDLAPTIASIVGVPSGPAPFQGRALGSPGPTGAVFPNGDAIDRSALLLARGAPGGTPLCIHRGRREEVPVSECDHLANRASTSREAAQAILDYDLHAAAGAAP